MQTASIRKVAFGSVSAIAISIGFTAGGATPAAAQTEIYAGGATLPAQIYRKIFNCYSGTGTPRSVDRNNIFDAAQCTTPANAPVRIGYAQVGSGAGQRAFIFDDPTRIGLVAPTNTVPFSTSTGPVPNSPALPAGSLPFRTTAPTGYPQHHWSGSDAIVPQTAVPPSSISFDCYNGNAAADPSCTVDRRTIAGPAIQVPTMTTTVNIPFRLPGRTTLRLSERSLCGIFTGNITNWNDPSISADNGGSVTGGTSRQIRVAVRADGSGTTFLFVNYLEAVCTPARTGVNWTGGVGTTATWTSPFFYKAPGNEGVNQVVAATPYAIGYSTPDLTQPATSTIVAPTTFTVNDGNGANPITVAAGSYPARPRAALENKSGAFRLPTPTSGRAALSSATPPTGAAASNAANWGVAGLVPDPTGSGAYPIAGFTWFNGYTCYASNAVGSGLRSFFGWYTSTTNSQLTSILNADQFGRLPANWQTATRSLVFSGATTKISGVTEAGRAPVCTGKPGA